MSEIVVGTVAQLIIGAAIGSTVLGTDESWVKFLAGIAAIVLTFLAGAELDPAVFRDPESGQALGARDVAHLKRLVRKEVEFPTKSGHGVKLYSVCSYAAGDTYPKEEGRRWLL